MKYNERLKALALQLTLTEEKERRNIASDLHDNIGHSLALARMQLDAVRRAASPTERAVLINDTSNILLAAVQETKSLIFELSSPLMNEMGLSAAISDWLEDYLERRYGLETHLIDKNGEITLDGDLRALLFRNVRELFTNIIKHANAKKVEVRLEHTSDVYRISISDDGIGFDNDQVSRDVKTKQGFGLFSIRERMADLGGSLEIRSQPGNGTTIIMSVPFQNNIGRQ
jgi:signal transduction histidine kinase